MFHVLCVATKAIAREVQDDKQQNQNDGDDAKNLHPAWRAAVLTVRVRGGFSHVRVLDAVRLKFIFRDAGQRGLPLE